MKIIVGFLLLLTSVATIPDDSAHIDEIRIARAMRMAVRQADSTLLAKTGLGNWRDYVKIATMELEPEVRPLVLIKFDEDISFRNQLKQIIEWECRWQKMETDHFIYYYRWDRPPPQMITEVQDAHCRRIVDNFQIEMQEKIPYRYDPEGQQNIAIPFDDLRGGIVSSHPLDLDRAAKSLFHLIDSDPFFLIEPIARIYGRYYQNPSTAAAYYEMCLQAARGQILSATALLSTQQFETEKSVEWYSSYCFAYKLNNTFAPAQIAQFIAQSSSDMSPGDLEQTFLDIFGMTLEAFEQQLVHPNTANKI